MTRLPARYPEDAFAAFAYLKDRKQLTADDFKVLALIECYGEGFYFKLADGVAHPEAKALLRRNGREEYRHGERATEVRRLLAAA